MIDLLFLLKESCKDTLVRSSHSYLPFPMKTAEDEVHLEKTMEWLLLACKNGQGGVSSHYNLLTGRWMDPFPETTGYIIPTFFNYAQFSRSQVFRNKAIQLTDWLGKVQLDNGACMYAHYNEKKGKTRPIIFNTGQNIFGFLRTYQETGDQKYLAHAIKAGNFLIDNVDDTGIWNRYLHNNIPHTYNSRTSWALLALYQETREENYRRVALANLNWVLEQQLPNGWFRNANSKPRDLPNTHFIAYTTRGLLESYLLTRDERYCQCARVTADRLLRLFEIRKYLYTFWDEKWKNHGKIFNKQEGRYICLTGNIQLAIVWMKLYQVTDDAAYLNAAFKMIDFIKSLHYIRSRKKEINGAIKGSFPVYGSYSIFKFPNWAAKFFADALMLKIKLMQELAEFEEARNNIKETRVKKQEVKIKSKESFSGVTG